MRRPRRSLPPITPLSFIDMHPAVTLEVARRNVPNAAANLLARHDDALVREAIASNPLVNASIIETLMNDPFKNVRRAAYQACTDSTKLIVRDKRPISSELVASSPNADPALLATLCTHSNRRVVRSAMENPNTPHEAAVAAAGRHAPDDLYSSSNTTAYDAHISVIAENHPGVAGPWGLSAPFRALLRQPNADSSLIAAAAKERRRGAWLNVAAGNPYLGEMGTLSEAGTRIRQQLDASFGGRPAKTVVDASDAGELSELAKIGSETLDILIAQAPAFDLDVLETLVKRTHDDWSFELTQINAQALGSALARTGASGALMARVELAGTRSAAAGVHCRNPYLYGHSQVAAAALDLSELDHLVESLGEDTNAWQTYLALSEEWSGSIAALFGAATKL